MDYFTVYKKRLNRFGNNHAARVQGSREAEFEHQLHCSVYYTTIEYEGQEHEVELAPYIQDNSETQAHLLTRTNLIIPAGEIFDITNYRGETGKWMVLWFENMQASGYNRYRMIKMSNYISWKGLDGNIYSSWIYLRGKMGEMKVDEQKTTSGHSTSAQPIYYEDLNKSQVIMPFHKYMDKDSYFEVIITDPNNVDTQGDPITKKQCYRVLGFDIVSQPGVEFLTVDAIYEFDQTPPPQKPAGTPDTDYYWFEGGAE